MIKFVFEDKTVRVPSEWEEVTVEHFINPDFLSGNSLSLLANLSGIPRQKLLNTTEDITGHLYKMVDFMQKDPQGYQKYKPEKITLQGKELDYPKDIEVERVGQKIMLQDAVSKYQFVYEAIPEAIAIYLQPELNDGVFDDAKLPELIEEVKGLRIVDVYPIADFFLTNSRRILKSGGTF